MSQNDDVRKQYDDISDCSTLTYKGLRKFWGEFARCFAGPILCLGVGPIRIVEQGNVGVLTSFGVFQRTLQPGTYSYNPLVEKIHDVCVMMQTMTIASQRAMTKDNVVVNVDAIGFFTVVDANRAIFEVENYWYAMKTLSASTLQRIIAEHSLQEVFSNRTQLNERLTQLMQEKIAGWGIQLSSVMLQDIKIPELMQRAMAQIAESTRQAEAKVITAEGQSKAAHIFSEAAETMSRNPMSLQLQWFETLRQISSEQHQTYIVPSQLISSGFTGTFLQQGQAALPS